MLGLSSRYFLTAFEDTLRKALDRIESFQGRRKRGGQRDHGPPHFLANYAKVPL